MRLFTLERTDTLNWLRAIVVAAVLLPLLTYSGAVWYLRQQAISNAALRVERAARVSEEHALKILETDAALLARTLDVLGDDSIETLHAREAALHQQFKRMSSGLPQMQGIFALDASGRLIASDRRFPAPRDIDFSDRASFKHHQGGSASPYVSELLTSRATGEPFFDLSVRRTLPSGEFGGTVSASMTPKYFGAFYRDLAGDDPELEIALIRSGGAVLARWPTTPTASDVPGSRPERIQLDTAASAGRAVLPGGDYGLLAARQLGPYPVHVAAWINEEAVNAIWLHQAMLLGLLMLPVSLGLVLSARVALDKTRRSLDDAARLREEVQQRQVVEDTLRQAQKLEAMGRLTGGVAHDFNNLLMIVSNSVFILSRKHPQLEGNAQTAAIARAVDTGAKLTRQLLSFSRRQPFRPESVALQERVPQLLDLIRPAVGSSITVAADVAADTLPVFVDAAELELALVNLSINAKDAMPGGGKVTVSARNVVPGGAPMKTDRPMVLITLTDRGQGISPENLKLVFEPFFTTKPAGHGTGLGLAQVYGFCQRAGGTAIVESELGKGTSVHLYLPAQLAQMSRASAETQDAGQLAGLKVLLAEDNQEVASATLAVLEVLGCSVHHVSDGDAAHATLNANRRAYDLLLSDIVMPGSLDGLALARYAKVEYPNLAILLMSGYSKSVAEAEWEGIEVLPKPCAASELAAAIGRATRRKVQSSQVSSRRA